MKEYAVLPLGINSFWGDARNPYNYRHETGGSSSGSAGAVAAGLVPLAIGTDRWNETNPRSHRRKLHVRWRHCRNPPSEYLIPF
jgi:aspartyl-tRNA(Asn)/glutamyl-tRNA(Gln) amidotransferase subunit A